MQSRTRRLPVQLRSSQHLSLNCTFDLPIKRPAPSSTVEELQNRIAYLENQLRSAGLSSALHPDGTDGTDGRATSSSSPDDDECPLASDGQYLSGSSGAFVPSYVPSDEAAIGRGALPTDADEDVKVSVGDAPTNTYSFLGSSSALFPLTITNQIPQTLKAAAQARSLKKIVRLEFWTLKTDTFDETLDQDVHAFWPDGTTARSLIDAYFDHLALTQPLGLERDEILAQYKEDPLQSGPDWCLGLLYAIFAVSAWHANVGLDLVNNRRHLVGLQWYLASRRLTPNEINLARPIATAQTLVLQTCFAMAHPPYIGNALRLAGSALCVMMDIGSHRQTLVKQPGSQLRARQLTFWSAYVLEKSVVTMSGRPSSLWSEWVDSSLPDDDEYPHLWMEAQIVLLAEKILKAKYTAKRPSARIALDNAKQIDTQMAFLIDEFERRKGSMDSGPRGNVEIGLHSIRLLLHQPELLAKAPTPPQASSGNNSGDGGGGDGYADVGAIVTPSTLATCVRAISRIIDVVTELDVGELLANRIGSICRATVLSHVMAQSRRKEIRETFIPLKARTLAIMRKGEARWMCSGKLSDLCVMKPVQDETAVRSSPPRRGSQRSPPRQQPQQPRRSQSGSFIPTSYDQLGSLRLGLPVSAPPPNGATASFADLMPSVSTPSNFSGLAALTNPKPEQTAPWPLAATSHPSGTPDSGSMSSVSDSTRPTSAHESGASSFDSYVGGNSNGNGSSNGNGDPWTALFPTLGHIEWPIHSQLGDQQQQQAQQMPQHQQQQQPRGTIDPFVFGSGAPPSGNGGQDYSPQDAASIFWNFDFGATTAGWF